jgi:sucrose-6F-phosphate phosphohydrolase
MNNPNGQYLLISDVDDTLLGEEKSLRDFSAWYAQHCEYLKLAYSSGRFYESIVQSVRDTPLPEPDAVIGGVGTNIRLHPSGEEVEAWHDVINQGWDPDRIRKIVEEFPDIEMQPEEFQSRFKISYYYHDAGEKELKELEDRFKKEDMEVTLVYSSSRDLDILPKGVSKGTAALFLASLWSFDKDHVIVAGNSGNDRALFEQGFYGIVVANAHEELKALKGPRIYQCRKEIAAGVLEGLKHWINGA